jgi:hypothetical protein
MECYALEGVDECDVPMLCSVPRAYILTMHATETFPWLHGVARRTYVQRNRGFRACAKTRGDGQRVDATNQDLIHAYRAVFERERDTTEPVLVFEDDALLTRTAKDDMPHVDRFVATHNFSVYSLGSVGVIVPHGQGHWRFFGGYFGLSQAIVYSPECIRTCLSATDASPHGHMDVSIIAPVPKKFTYYRPLAYQPLDSKNKSENSATWCFFRCNGGVIDSVMRSVSWACIGALGLHTERGWYTLYAVQKALVPVFTTIVGLVIGLLVSCIVRHGAKTQKN